jgi:hypothetical protein
LLRSQDLGSGPTLESALTLSIGATSNIEDKKHRTTISEIIFFNFSSPLQAFYM